MKLFTALSSSGEGGELEIEKWKWRPGTIYWESHAGTYTMSKILHWPRVQIFKISVCGSKNCTVEDCGAGEPVARDFFWSIICQTCAFHRLAMYSRQSAPSQEGKNTKTLMTSQKKTILVPLNWLVTIPWIAILKNISGWSGDPARALWWIPNICILHPRFFTRRHRAGPGSSMGSVIKCTAKVY